MIIVYTNRVLNKAPSTNRTVPLFGETPNIKGSSELRISLAAKDPKSGEWLLELQPEPPEADAPPSKILFKKVLDRIRAGTTGQKWVILVHGYGQSFLESLEQAHKLQQRHRGNTAADQINIILFSWPSHPGGTLAYPSTYRAAQAAAIPSAAALAIAIKRIWDYFAFPAIQGESNKKVIKDFSMCLYAHSQGNLVLEVMTRSKALAGSLVRLDSVILHQADVDAHDHPEWINMLSFGTDVIITLNGYDRVLRLSDAINPERLGIARNGFTAKATYFDFTGGDSVDATHNLFAEVDNQIVRLFCNRVLRGHPSHQLGGEVNGFWWDSSAGAWRLGQRSGAFTGGSSKPGS